MSYQTTAASIIQSVGGAGNITALTHCATRLRFNLADEKKADKAALEALPEVMGVAIGGGQYQVIIGSDVRHVYQAIQESLGSDRASAGSAAAQEEPKSLLNRFLNTISSIFTPILPAITAAGMIKAVLALLVAFKWVDNTAQTYQIINFMADAGFYFLPILLANSAAKKFNCNLYLAMMVGGILLHPNFIGMVNAARESGEAIKLAVLPIYSATYSSTVVPIILSVWFMSYIERWADKHSPKMIKYFTVPLIATMVTGVVALTILGPIGYIIGNGIASGINFLDLHMGWLVPMVIGAFFPLLVLTGTHYGIIPIGANNIMTVGYDAMIGPGNLASNIAQGGAALGVGLKTKDKAVKEVALSAGITAVCGITEPALFGINMRFKTPLYAAMLGGGVGGLFIGAFGVRRYASGSPGLMTLPVYIGEDGLSNLLFACIGAAIAFAVSFAAAYFMFKEENVQEGELDQLVAAPSEATPPAATAGSAAAASVINVFSPVAGKKIPLQAVNDPAFASGVMGAGYAVIPEDETFYSPVDGEVAMVFETKHAIGLRSDEGAEILIHVGLDTVKMGGSAFEALVQQGQRVKKGQPILKADLAAIKAAGYDTITPVIVTNTADFSDVVPTDTEQLQAGQPVLEVAR